MYGRECMYGRLWRRDKLLAEAHGNNVDPRISGLSLSYEGEFIDANLARTIKLRPALARNFKCAGRVIERIKFGDGQVWHKRPLLVVSERSGVEPIVEFTHAI